MAQGYTGVYTRDCMTRYMYTLYVSLIIVMLLQTHVYARLQHLTQSLRRDRPRQVSGHREAGSEFDGLPRPCCGALGCATRPAMTEL